MNKSFDPYADQYSRVITEGARVSGETYEYFVELRTKLFKDVISNEIRHLTAPSILDFGCGTGYTIERLSTLFPDAYLYGFDTSSESISHAINRNIPSACFSHGDACTLPYTDNSINAIYSNGTFHHIVQHERTTWMNELHRVLEMRGVLVIFENNPLNPLMMQAMRRTPFDVDADPIRAGKLAAIMKSVGLKPDNPRYYFFFPHILKWLRFCEPMLRFVPLGAQFFIRAIK
jgi:trans-aconitate methyltransferase